jgi:hypothetical protein
MQPKNLKNKLQKIVDRHEYDERKSGTVTAISMELLERFSEIDDLVIVGNPWCIEEMIYTLEEINDASLWNYDDDDKILVPDYTAAEQWIEENENF